MTTLTTLPIGVIDAHPRNVRRDVGAIDELAHSIKGVGILQPLTVAPQDDSYILIAGHRRLAAAQKAGLTEVPVVIREDLANDLAKQLQAQLVENLMRSDLTVMEEADAYAQLELLGVKEAAISKTTGRSRKTVHERILLASLPTERREQYETGKLSLDGAVKCAKLREQYADDAEILALIDEAQTWAFGDNYGVKHRIDRLLEDRRRATEPDPEPDDDEDALDYAGKRAEREAEWEKARQERQQRADALNAMRDRAFDWLSGRIVARDPQVIDGLLDWAIDDTFDNWNVQEADLALLGIEPCGEDEDQDDAVLRQARAAHALSHDDKVILLALLASSATDRHAYDWRDWADRYTALGHRLTADEQTLIKPAAVEEDDDEVE